MAILECLSDVWPQADPPACLTCGPKPAGGLQGLLRRPTYHREGLGIRLHQLVWIRVSTTSGEEKEPGVTSPLLVTLPVWCTRTIWPPGNTGSLSAELGTELSGNPWVMRELVQLWYDLDDHLAWQVCKSQQKLGEWLIEMESSDLCCPAWESLPQGPTICAFSVQLVEG